MASKAESRARYAFFANALLAINPAIKQKRAIASTDSKLATAIPPTEPIGIKASRGFATTSMILKALPNTMATTITTGTSLKTSSADNCGFDEMHDLFPLELFLQRILIDLAVFHDKRNIFLGISQ